MNRPEPNPVRYDGGPMGIFGNLIQSDDWKKEKHVPVIDCADSIMRGDSMKIEVSVGKEIPHPNTAEHHIRWIQLFYKPYDEKFAYQLGNWEFTAHGESVAGANQGCVHSEPTVVAVMTITKPGTLYALSLCNIHGLWEDHKELSVVA
jgi:superoxide reductase